MSISSGRARIEGGRPLNGVVRPPGDKSISHRALILGWLAQGTTTISGLSDGDDVIRTLQAVRSLGAEISVDENDVVTVVGGRVVQPEEPLDLGNSGTAIRLLTGACAGLEVDLQLTGDASLSTRPMDRVAIPLREMGAKISGNGDDCRPPLQVTAGPLKGIDYAMPVASAQVKSAVLLAGLIADGPTVVRSPAISRMHTEEMLATFGADISVSDDLLTSTIRPGQLVGTEVSVPGDPSQAAFWVVAACVADDSEITVPSVYLGPARAGFVDVLRRMGADLTVDDSAGSITARTSELVATTIEGDEIAGLVDEIPALMVAAAHARGVSQVRNAEELRVKETDRVKTTAAMLRAFGIEVAELVDGLSVAGGPMHDRVTTVQSGGDHRIAMAGAVAAMSRSGQTVVEGWGAVDTSYPGFLADLRALGGEASS